MPSRRAWLGQTGVVLLLVVSAVACDQPLEPRVQAGSQATPQVAPPAADSGPVSLEFELPDEFFQKDSDGRDVVTGFKVGYFQRNASQPVSTITISRDRVVVNGGTAKIALDSEHLQKGPYVRLQTMTRGTLSGWSDASQLLGSATETSTGKGGARRQRVAMSDVEKHPRLAEALKKLLPEKAEPDALLAPFRTMNELAVAVVVCRDHRLPFADISATMTGPPRQSFRNAARIVKPGLRGSQFLATAEPVAAELLDKRTKRKSGG